MHFFSSKALQIVAALLLSSTISGSAFAQSRPEIHEQLDQGSHTLIVKLTIQAAQVNEFLHLMKSRIQQSRNASAVVDFRFFGSADPLIFYGVESFTNKEAFTAFAQSPESKAFAEALKGMLEKPLEVQFLHPLP